MFKLVLAVLSVLSVEAFAAKKAESIIGFTADPTGVTFQVPSGGCTRKEHFTFLNSKSINPVWVRLKRNEPDYCEAYMPYGTKISFTWAEMGVPQQSTFKIQNPIEGIYVKFE